MVGHVLVQGLFHGVPRDAHGGAQTRGIKVGRSGGEAALVARGGLGARFQFFEFCGGNKMEQGVVTSEW